MNRSMVLLVVTTAMLVRGETGQKLADLPVDESSPHESVLVRERLPGLLDVQLRATYLTLLGASTYLSAEYHFGWPLMVRVMGNVDFGVGAFDNTRSSARALLEAGLDLPGLAVLIGGGVQADGSPGLLSFAVRAGTLDGLNLDARMTLAVPIQSKPQLRPEVTASVPVSRGVTLQAYGSLETRPYEDAYSYRLIDWRVEGRVRIALSETVAKTRVGFFLTPIVGVYTMTWNTVVAPTAGLILTFRH